MSQIKVGIIGGTGLAEAIAGQTTGTSHEIQTPFGEPSGPIIETEWHGLPLLFLSRHGAGHMIPPTHVPFRANIFALKQLGCTHIIASGAVGSLREEFRPRDLVIPDQVIDKTSRRPGTFYEAAAVHVEFAEPFCPALRQILLEAGAEFRSSTPASGAVPGEHDAKRPLDPSIAAEQAPAGGSAPATFTVHGRGCYVCMEGPAFSTRAESLMHRLWGGDLIGMTAMPEAKLAREAEISYALVALVTDYDCWRNRPASPDAPATTKVELLKEIIENLQVATANAVMLIKRAVALVAERQQILADLAAHHSLELAIWSNKSRIPVEQVQRLAPLWIKYFGSPADGDRPG